MSRTKRSSVPIAALAGALYACGGELSVPAEHPGSPDAPTQPPLLATALKSDFDPSSKGTGNEHAGHTHTPAPDAHQHESTPSSPSQAQPPAETIYTCPMHPEIQRKEPGNCPICGMKLVPKKDRKR